MRTIQVAQAASCLALFTCITSMTEGFVSQYSCSSLVCQNHESWPPFSEEGTSSRRSNLRRGRCLWPLMSSLVSEEPKCPLAWNNYTLPTLSQLRLHNKRMRRQTEENEVRQQEPIRRTSYENQHSSKPGRTGPLLYPFRRISNIRQHDSTRSPTHGLAVRESAIPMDNGTPFPYAHSAMSGSISPLSTTISSKSALSHPFADNIETPSDFTTPTNAAAATVAATAKGVVLNPLEVWFLCHLDYWYVESQRLKCPFWRRRFGDMLDNMENVIKHTVIRRECWPLMGPPQAWRGPNANSDYMKNIVSRASSSSSSSACPISGMVSRIVHGSDPLENVHENGSRGGLTFEQLQETIVKEDYKQRGLTMEELQEIIRHDWRADTTQKGYYVTGKLTTTIYRNDCFFDGPDPDMPVRGLRKYMGVANNLFDASKSQAVLLHLGPADEDDPYIDQHERLATGSKATAKEANGRRIVAHWEMRGVLKLPWRPKLPTFRGTTIYHIDSDGLIELHEEMWNMSVPQAFCHTFFPGLASRIWE